LIVLLERTHVDLVDHRMIGDWPSSPSERKPLGGKPQPGAWPLDA
jgi:hypothetical protein